VSQINDALRRASDAAKATGDNTPHPLLPPPLPGADDASSEVPLPITAEMLAPPIIGHMEPRRGSRKVPVIGLVLVVICAAGAAGFRFWKSTHRFSKSGFSASMEKKLAMMDAPMSLANSNPVTNAISSSAGFATSTSAVATAKPPEVAVAPKPAPVAPPRPIVPAVVVNSTPAKFPPLRLQSIFYRPPNPSVMINGKLLCVSDEIQGVMVADIQPSSVTLVLSGYTNVLTLR
jgi:hypothetical protein